MTKADELRELAARLEVPATVAIRLRKIAVELDQMAKALRAAREFGGITPDRAVLGSSPVRYVRDEIDAALRAAGYEVPQ